METRANYVLIGLFTLLVVAGGFGFVYWFSQTGTGIERTTYRVVFQGSVAGLRAAAPVLFNGLRVGEVADLHLNPDNPKEVVAIISVDTKVKVRKDTVVGLDFQGLTGIASLTLKGGSITSPVLVSENKVPPTLYADPNATQDMTTAIREVATNAEQVLRRVDGLLANNEAQVHQVIVNIQEFTATLNRNSDRLDNIFANVESLTASDTKREILDAVRSVRTLAENLDKRTAEISAGLTRFSNSGLREYEQLAIDGRRTLADLDRAIRNLDRNPSRVLFGGGNSVPEYSGRR